MSGTASIQYIRHEEIDRKKWDQCIDSASNGLIYGYSFYLDHMAHEWDALVMNDYEVVMPLTAKKKYGISYLAQPFLTAQLGVFGDQPGPEVLSAFLHSIPKKFRYCDIYLNHGNVYQVDGFDLYHRSNYVLNLNHSYFELQARYRDNTRRNIKKSSEAGCKPGLDIHIEKVISLALHQMRDQGSAVKQNIADFRKIYYHLHKQGKARIYAILSPKNDLLSSAVFFYSHGRAYYILVGNHPKGRDVGASHTLIDAFIRDHAGQPLILDFEGSDLENLAFFYSSYGAKEEQYAGLKWNRLPFFLRWLKK